MGIYLEGKEYARLVILAALVGFGMGAWIGGVGGYLLGANAEHRAAAAAAMGRYAVDAKTGEPVFVYGPTGTKTITPPRSD